MKIYKSDSWAFGELLSEFIKMEISNETDSSVMLPLSRRNVLSLPVHVWIDATQSILNV